jgi:pimeloyl-ACP methyl ester carboxylesterase
MAADSSALLEGLEVAQADVIGWSDGGVVALLLARDRPDLVRRVIALGANVDAGPGEPRHLASADDADQARLTPERLGLEARFARALVAMWRSPHGISFADLGRIAAPILFIAGDRDLITLDHTVAMFRAAADAQVAVVPAAGHDVALTHPELVASLIERFLDA